MPQDELTVVVEYDTVAVQIDEPTVPIGVTLISNMGPPGPQGDQGPSGPIGPTGPKGDKGDTGDTGPTGPDGIQGPQGDPGLAGADGSDGIDGATWYSGSGAPVGGLGMVNDWYFDLTTGDVYLKTGSSTWTLEINLIGPAGADGAQGPQGDPGPAGADGATGATWYSGSGAPSSGTGVNGDFYFQIDTGDVYKKISGSWGSPISNLTGPTGSSGSASDVGCKIYNDAAISIASGSYIALTFNSEQYDNNNMHSVSTNTGRIVASTPGKYIIIGGVRFASSGGAGDRGLAIRKNGTTFYGLLSPSSGSSSMYNTVSAIVDLNSGDYVELLAYQNSVGSMALSGLSGTGPEFSAQLIAGPVGPAGADGTDGVGVPTGGTTDQILAKASNTDYDTEWVDNSGGSGDVAGDTHAATSKTTPVDADELPLADSAASFVLKKLTWVNLKATLKTYFDTLYKPKGNTVQVELFLGTPDASGNGYSTLISTANIRQLVPAFLKDVDGDWWGRLRIPQDYSSGGAIILRLAANDTNGTVTSFIVSTKVVDTAATWDAALTDETVQDITMSTTAYQPTDATFTLTTTPIAGKDLLFKIRHNGTRSQDTLAQDTLLFRAIFQYVAA